MEGGPPIFRQDGSCPALLEDRCPGFPYGAVTRSGPPFQTLPVPKTTATGLFRVRSPLLAESRLMSVPPATEMFQFAGFASCTYEFSTGYPGSRPGWVAPFGDPGITDRSHLPRAFRSVPRPSSPLSAKASTRCPSFALDHRIPVAGDAAPPPRTGPSPMPCPAKRERRPRMKTLLSDTPGTSFARPRPVRLGHITTLSSPFNQPPPRSPAAVSLYLLRTSRAAGVRCRPFGAAPPAQPGFAGGGGERIRTDDLLLAKQALSQLSYTPFARDQNTEIRI